jgi:hypothetical protein
MKATQEARILIIGVRQNLGTRGRDWSGWALHSSEMCGLPRGPDSVTAQVYQTEGVPSPGHPDEMGAQLQHQLRSMLREYGGELPPMPVLRGGSVLLPGVEHHLSVDDPTLRRMLYDLRSEPGSALFVHVHGTAPWAEGRCTTPLPAAARPALRAPLTLDWAGASSAVGTLLDLRGLEELPDGRLFAVAAGVCRVCPTSSPHPTTPRPSLRRQHDGVSPDDLKSSGR